MLNSKEDIEKYHDYYVRTKNGLCFLVKPNFGDDDYKIVCLTTDNRLIKVESPKQEQLENALLNLFLQKTHTPKSTDDLLEIGLVQSLYIHLFDVALSKKWNAQTFVEKVGLTDKSKDSQRAINALAKDVFNNRKQTKKEIKKNDEVKL